MPIIIREINKKDIVFTNNYKELVEKIIDLNNQNINYKTFETSINPHNGEYLEEICPLSICLFTDLDLNKTIKKIIITDNTKKESIYIFSNSNKIVKPMEILETYKDNINELNLKVTHISTYYSKEYYRNNKNIYENFETKYIFNNDYTTWTTKKNVKKRTF